MKTNFKFPKKIFIATILFGGLFYFYSCQKDIGPIVIPQNTQINFETQIQQPILNLKCAVTACHDNTTQAGSLDLTTGFAKANIVSVVSQGYGPSLIVAPYHPENSVLIHKIVNDDPSTYGVIMPQGPYAPLATYEIDIIKTWINQGAN